MAALPEPSREATQALQRAKTMDARYPIAESCGCCRVVTELDFEYTTYRAAVEAHLGQKPFDYKRLESCVSDLNQLLQRIAMEGPTESSSILARRFWNKMTCGRGAGSRAAGEEPPISLEHADQRPCPDHEYMTLGDVIAALRETRHQRMAREIRSFYIRLLLEDITLLYVEHEGRDKVPEDAKAEGRARKRLVSFSTRQQEPRSSSGGPASPGCQRRDDADASTYIVIGLFSNEVDEPTEVCVRIVSTSKDKFLPILKSHVQRLRWRQSVFSFRKLSGFGMYKCIPPERAHVPYDTSPAEKAMLAQLFRATMASTNPSSPFSKPQASNDWANYVHFNLNQSQEHPYYSELSLQLHLRWSRLRFTIAALIPLLLSLAIGAWYTIDHGDEHDAVSAAWGKVEHSRVLWRETTNTFKDRVIYRHSRCIPHRPPRSAL